MKTRRYLALTLLLCTASAFADNEARVTDDVVAYRAQLIGEMRAALAGKGIAAQSTLVRSPTGDDRADMGADRMRVITAVRTTSGLRTTCHWGVEAAAAVVAAAQGDRDE